MARRRRGCTGKRRYRDEIAALLAVAVVNHRAGWELKRVYECRFCRGWHVTSQEKRRREP